MLLFKSMAPIFLIGIALAALSFVSHRVPASHTSAPLRPQCKLIAEMNGETLPKNRKWIGNIEECLSKLLSSSRHGCYALDLLLCSGQNKATR